MKIGGQAVPKVGENKGNAGKGRPKGSPNKTTRAIREAVVEAFDKAGGVDYLVQLAKEDPRTFCTLIGRVIPLQVEGEMDQNIVFKTVYEGKK
jgi:hypothetical protein